MSFVVDTDTCSAYLKGHSLVWNRFLQYAGQLHLSVITLAELTIWERRANSPPRRAQEIQDLLQVVTLLDTTLDVARKFGEIQAGFLDVGQRVPEMDLLIAATALVHGFTVVTHNT